MADDSLMTTPTAAMIFFELQYMLHSHNNRMDIIPASKMLVSNLMLTPIIPNSTFRRGFMIEIEYIKYIMLAHISNNLNEPVKCLNNFK